jgi:hypothetical protein
LELVVEIVEAVVVAAAALRNGSKFSKCNMACGGFPWARHSGSRRFHSGWCFISAWWRKEKRKKEKRKKKEKKNSPMGKEGFPRAGPTLLAVQWFAAVRFN